MSKTVKQRKRVVSVPISTGLQELEQLERKMTEAGADLDQALEYYQAAVQLAQQIQSSLSTMQLRIETISGKSVNEHDEHAMDEIN
jgi:exodeoxyribonuclease VII small subunit